jgi:hypothetical protein
MKLKWMKDNYQKKLHWIIKDKNLKHIQKHFPIDIRDKDEGNCKAKR